MGRTKQWALFPIEKQEFSAGCGNKRTGWRAAQQGGLADYSLGWADVLDVNVGLPFSTFCSFPTHLVLKPAKNSCS